MPAAESKISVLRISVIGTHARLLEDFQRNRDISLAKVIGKARDDACGHEFSRHVLAAAATPLEAKHILHLWRRSFHAHDFRNGFNASHAVLVPPHMNDEVEGGNDLFADCPRR